MKGPGLSPMRTILTINSGSSSIKFALFNADESLVRILEGTIEGIGFTQACFTIKNLNEEESFSRSLVIPDHSCAVDLLMSWIQEQVDSSTLIAIGHRVVHGGQKYVKSQLITSEMIKNLHDLCPFAPEHLPQEITLIEAFDFLFPHLAQVACFDTTFHHDMPRVARQLPIPGRYESQGVQRYGFHGLSYSYVMKELESYVGKKAAMGRVILAHLGGGASMAAVLDGRSQDTSMGFTPAAGLMMGTRSGDIDPGLVAFLAQSEHMSASQFDHMINHESGLLGVSETSADMQDLLARETQDVRAREAVALFCYQAKKMIGAYAAVLGGLDILIFSGGIGENSSLVRTRICQGLEFLGIKLDESLNGVNAKIISSKSSQARVCVIRTDEEKMIAVSVYRILDIDK